MGGGNRTSTNRNRKLTTGLPAAAAAAAAVTAVMSFLDQEAEGRKDIPELPESLAAGEACCAEFVASSLPLMMLLPTFIISVGGWRVLSITSTGIDVRSDSTTKGGSATGMLS